MSLVTHPSAVRNSSSLDPFFPSPWTLSLFGSSFPSSIPHYIQSVDQRFALISKWINLLLMLFFVCLFRFVCFVFCLVFRCCFQIKFHRRLVDVCPRIHVDTRQKKKTPGHCSNSWSVQRMERTEKEKIQICRIWEDEKHQHQEVHEKGKRKLSRR